MKEETVSQLIDRIGEYGKRSKYLYEQYKQVEELKVKAKALLIQKLNEAGFKSAKTDNFIASITKKPGIQVLHEQSVLEWLKEAPNIETDQYIGLKKTEFKSLALTMLKDTGEIIPGTELIETESIGIRKSK